MLPLESLHPALMPYPPALAPVYAARDGSPGCALDVWETPPRTDSYIHPYAKRGKAEF
jgi:hypothetical protein